MRAAEPGFLRALRQLANDNGLLLIFDEIQSGAGRTGKFYAHEWSGVTPDILASAKGIGGGFPIGAVLATAEAAKGMTAGTHGSTYGGNPLGMAVGNEAVGMMLEPGFLEHVAKVGNYLHQQLVGLVAAHPDVFAEVRGQGLLLGLKLKPPVGDFVNAARAEGLLTVGAGENVVRILPPLNVSEAEVREALGMLEKAAMAMEKQKVAAQ
jgi:acetylornithine/N-succinyldiaminopimelate aminotransferase